MQGGHHRAQSSATTSWCDARAASSAASSPPSRKTTACDVAGGAGSLGAERVVVRALHAAIAATNTAHAHQTTESRGLLGVLGIEDAL
jgi:hypothetical protein